MFRAILAVCAGRAKCCQREIRDRASPRRHAPLHPQLRSEGLREPQGNKPPGKDERRQCVNFALYKVDPAWRRLLATEFGRYLSTPYSYLSMTKRSIYVREHQHPGQEGTHLRLTPGKFRYLFVYPFIKTRAWCPLSMDERQRTMNEDMEIGHKYPAVRLNTTHSFGLDHQEFVVAFESDRPKTSSTWLWNFATRGPACTRCAIHRSSPACAASCLRCWICWVAETRIVNCELKAKAFRSLFLIHNSEVTI